MNILSNQPKLLFSSPYPCDYLKPETAAAVQIDPDYQVDNALFSLLLKSGFRRSGDIIYRPHCRNCNACISVRIPASDYVPNRAQRRTCKRNRDIYTTIVPAQYKDEHFDLYRRYQSWRHAGDVMDQDDPARYKHFMIDSPIETVCMEFRINDILVALSICDLPDDGLSAVYTFFDPDLSRRSLGTFAIMKQIEYVKRMQLDWVYLGYWIKGCKKMSYKTNFTPIFGFVNKEWKLLSL